MFQAYISTNFTSKPNTPGRFIVWFRNETTLLVLWQPPYPAGFYTDYKVSIKPEDALYSETLVVKEGEPPGPAQAAFNGLVPGRAYNISVETVSEGQISDPTTAQYRTVPLRPHNVTFDPLSVGPDSFTVRWSGPDGISEFDRYQVTLLILLTNLTILTSLAISTCRWPSGSGGRRHRLLTGARSWWQASRKTCGRGGRTRWW